jgi:adenylosuccinate synthase
VLTGCGIVIDVNEILEDSKNIERELIQVDIQDTFHEARAGLVFSYSIAMNPNRLISVLTKNVVFIRRVSETTYELSTISITKDDELIYFSFQMKENFPPSS